MVDNLGSSHAFSVTPHLTSFLSQPLMVLLHSSKAYSVCILLTTIRSSVRVATCPTFSTFSASSTVLSPLKKPTYKTRIHSVLRSVREYLSRMMCQRRAKFDPLWNALARWWR
jgi:hypothetical protein